MNQLLCASTFLATLGCALMAGLFFTFLNFVMKALGNLPPAKGIAAMQSINVAVLSPLFLSIFMGTAIVCLILAIFSIARWHEPASGWLLTGALLYIIGTFLVTMLFNVPLNNALLAVNADSAEAIRVWRDYLSRWTAWNHVRTVTSLAATASLITALGQLRQLLR